jgi:hypothetical protein
VWRGADSFSAREGKTFSHVFHAERSLLELFLIKRGLMGPCWLFIRNPVANDVRVRPAAAAAVSRSPR